MMHCSNNGIGYFYLIITFDVRWDISQQKNSNYWTLENKKLQKCEGKCKTA